MIWAPPGTMGRTISSMSRTQSMTQPHPAFRAAWKAASISFWVVTRKPLRPYASANFTKSGPRSRVVSEYRSW